MVLTNRDEADLHVAGVDAKCGEVFGQEGEVAFSAVQGTGGVGDLNHRDVPRAREPMTVGAHIIDVCSSGLVVRR